MDRDKASLSFILGISDWSYLTAIKLGKYFIFMKL